MRGASVKRAVLSNVRMAGELAEADCAGFMTEVADIIESIADSLDTRAAIPTHTHAVQRRSTATATCSTGGNATVVELANMQRVQAWRVQQGG